MKNQVQEYFKNKVVWITGASSGMGEQLCYLLDELGAWLILSSRNTANLQKVRDNLKKGKSSARILPLDLEQLDSLPRKAAEAESFFGRIDILVNNAGLAVRDFALETRLDIDRKLMDVNYFGAVALTKAVLPGMIRRNGGHIVVVSISSLSAKMGVPRASAYAAAKHALHGFFDSLRSELTHPAIFITLLMPGIVQTEITAHGLKGDGSSFGKVEEAYRKAYPADKAAWDCAKAIAAGKEEQFIGGSEGLLLAIQRLAPGLTKKIIQNHPLKRLRKLKRFFSLKKERHSPAGAEKLNWRERLRLILHVLRWRLTWGRRDLDYRDPNVASPKFITAREAAAMIPDEACVFSSGIAGNARCAIFFYAIREHFLKTGHPNNLTWMNGGAQGSRGKVPGTVEELGAPGLMRRYIAAHLETAKAELKMADMGLLGLHTLPQGIMSLLLEEQAAGNDYLATKVGVGTFLDPRVGRGSAISPAAANEFVRTSGEGLIYTMPKVDIALFNAPYADSEGNIYFKHAATITEDVQSLKAAHANGGKVMVTVSKIIPKQEADISLKAAAVDYIVVNRWNEQTSSVLQRKYWRMFTPDPDTDARRAIRQLKFINTLLKITPVRGETGDVMARLAATLFVKLAPKGSMVNIGAGFPEEVARILVEQNLENDILFTTEAGSYGGLPAPGIFFGAAIRPLRIETSSVMFRRYQKELEVAILGFLQVDSEGNVNVSKRGPRMLDYVGPGGFPDIVNGARIIIFIGNWMANARFSVESDCIKLVKPGIPKFVERVDEITFSGKEALRHGKQVFYVTNVGIFRLTEMGVELMLVLPGVEVERDIISCSNAHIFLPEDGKLPIAQGSFLNDKTFRLDWDSALLNLIGMEVFEKVS